MSSTTREAIRPAEAVAGLLAAAAIFLGLTELAYRPFRLAPMGVLLLLVAAVMGSEREQTLVRIGFAAVGIGFIAGAALQIITHHPLY